MKFNKKILPIAVGAVAAMMSAPAALAAVTVSDPDGDNTRVNAPRIGPGQTVNAEAITITYTAATDVDADSDPTTFYVDAPPGTTFSAAPTASTGSTGLFFSDGSGGISQNVTGVLSKNNTRATWTISSAGAAGSIAISSPTIALAATVEVDQIVQSSTTASGYDANDLKYTVAVAPTGSGATPAISTNIVAAVQVASIDPQQVIENILDSQPFPGY